MPSYRQNIILDQSLQLGEAANEIITNIYPQLDPTNFLKNLNATQSNDLHFFVAAGYLWITSNAARQDNSIDIDIYFEELQILLDNTDKNLALAIIDFDKYFQNNSSWIKTKNDVSMCLGMWIIHNVLKRHFNFEEQIIALALGHITSGKDEQTLKNLVDVVNSI